jgi:hypothetical protein
MLCVNCKSQHHSTFSEKIYLTAEEMAKLINPYAMLIDALSKLILVYLFYLGVVLCMYADQSGAYTQLWVNIIEFYMLIPSC